MDVGATEDDVVTDPVPDDVSENGAADDLDESPSDDASLMPQADVSSYYWYDSFGLTSSAGLFQYL